MGPKIQYLSIVTVQIWSKYGLIYLATGQERSYMFCILPWLCFMKVNLEKIYVEMQRPSQNWRNRKSFAKTRVLPINN